MKQKRRVRLVDELQRSQRFTLWVLVSVLLLSLVTSGYLLLVSQPRISGYVELARESRDAHDGMLDQETGLRAWLATGDKQFLEPYETGKENTERAVARMLEEVQRSLRAGQVRGHDAAGEAELAGVGERRGGPHVHRHGARATGR